MDTTMSAKSIVDVVVSNDHMGAMHRERCVCRGDGRAVHSHHRRSGHDLVNDLTAKLAELFESPRVIIRQLVIAQSE